ncbi:DUF1659 domain-containing protein [Bacillus sp. HMF5848]|nr:DUF1659 domain-containing protein [Bacillus sp. HMF5848]
MDSQLRLVYVVGVTESGDPVLKSKNYNNVKTDALAEDLFSVAQAIASLQQYDVDHVERNNTRFLYSI